MARYGGGEESFREQKARMDAMAARIDSLTSKELAADDALNTLAGSEERVAARKVVTNRARREGADLVEREAKAVNQETAALNVNASAIERNAQARRQRAAQARAEAIDMNRARQGAVDPLYGQASVIAQQGGGIRQYRQQLGIGYGRARRIQDAIESGVTPAPPGGVPHGPTSTRSAQAVIEADIQYAAARKAYTAAINRGDAEAAAAAAADRDAAIAYREKAKAGTAAAEAAAASSAADREAAVAAREKAAAAPAAGAPGMALIPHPAYGPQGRFPMGWSQPTTDAERELYGTRISARPGAVSETYAGGTYPPRPGSAALGQTRGMQAAQAAGLSDLTRAENEYLRTLETASEREAVLRNRERAPIAQEQIAARSLTTAGALQREGAAFGSVSQAMTKHGALTQEYILAAARGETTLRELGNQALVTAGKFAGWTAAATGIFGVARALGQVAHGAMQAQSGAQNLQRFIPGQTNDQSYQGFVQVSREVNAPIEDVSNTQQVFARVFRNQQDSLTATSTALKAYKLDQIDAADSTRYFTAISQEFNLPASRLPLLFDQISAAQRRMGARVAENLPAIARSAAAVKNAGGDLTQLAALTATAQVSTGQTGNVVGTAFSRAAANFSRTPANRKIIESFGIDVGQGFTQMLIQAVDKSSSLSGDDRTKLAKAIGGPQYGGRIFQSLLGQDTRLHKALDIVDPANAAGSANDELRKKLQGADEMVKRLGTDLQQLGVVLAQSGAFDFAGLFLKSLDLLLNGAVHVVEIFDKLPKPLREAVSIMAEMAILMKLLQRFAPASLLNSSVGRALGGPELGVRQRGLRGLRDTSTAARDEAERTARTSFTAVRAEDTARIRAQRANAEYASAKAAASAETTVASQQRLAAAEAELAHQNAIYAKAAERALMASQEAADTASLAAAADARYAEAKAMSVRELKASNMFAPTALENPQYGGPRRLGTGEGSERVREEGLLAPVGTKTLEDTAGKEAQKVDALSGRARSATTAVEEYGAKMRGGLVAYGVTGSVAARAAQATEAAAVKGIAVADAAAASMAGAGKGLAGFAASLGPLDIAILGFLGLTALNDALSHINDDVTRAGAELDKFKPSGNTGEDIRSLTAKANALADHGIGSRGRMEDNAKIANDFINPLNLPGNLIKSLSGNYEDPRDARAAQVKEIRDQADNLALVQRLQADHERRGLPLAQLTLGQVTKRIDSDAALRRQGVISQQEFDRRMAKHAIEVKTMMTEGPHDLEQARSALAGAQLNSTGSGQNYRNLLQQMTGKELQQQVEAVSSKITDTGGNSEDFRKLALIYERQSQYYGHGSAAGIIALSNARQAYYKTVTEAVQAELSVATRAGSTEGERQAAYGRAAAEYRRRLLGRAQDRVATLRENLTRAREQQRQAQADAQISAPDNNFGEGALGQMPFVHSAALTDAAKAARDRVRQLKSRIGGVNKEIEAAKHVLQGIEADLKDTRYQDRQSSRQTDLALAQSQTTDPMQQARDAVNEASAQLADARRTYGAGSDPYKQALTALNNARHGVDDAIKSDAQGIIQAETALAQAQGPQDALSQARIAERGAQRLLGIAKTRKERLDALVAIAQADLQVRQAIKAAGDAHYDLLESMTTDPIRQAHLETQKARADIANTTGADRETAQANYRRARQAERDARLSGKEGDIDFEKEMGRITTSAAIAQYRSLLNIHNLTKQQRRDILLKIHQLESESEQEAQGFNLDVGSIRMPTLYDVRKAWDPIRKQAHAAHDRALSPAADIRNNVSHMYETRASVTANVKVIVNDPKAAGEVYKALDRAMGTHVRARLRSKGLR